MINDKTSKVIWSKQGKNKWNLLFTVYSRIKNYQRLLIIIE